ncbi:MAG: hypothetical protein WCP20_10970 [Desulfuromonadales bacterium]
MSGHDGIEYVEDEAENGPVPVGTVTMIRRLDRRINHVLTANVQDYLDSGLWEVVE